jgi:xylulokinase
VGAIHAGDAFDVSGTSEMIAVCLPHPVAPPELLARWHVVPDVWALIGAISTPGAAWQWLGRMLYLTADGRPGPTPHDALTQEAAASPPGAHGVVFLPHMMGERAPIWDPHARGVFFGLSLSTTRGDMIRAVMEGAAYAMRHLLELIEDSSGVRVQRVVTVGGASRNALWRQIKADVWNVELVTSPVSEATALGAAITAAVGVGLYGDYAEAVSQMVPPAAESIRPDPAQHARYEHPYRVYRRLYPALAESMRFAVTGQ